MSAVVISLRQNGRLSTDGRVPIIGILSSCRAVIVAVADIAVVINVVALAKIPQ